MVPKWRAGLGRTPFLPSRGRAPTGGFRNLPRGDVDALVEAIVALSRLALVTQPLVLEAEINPVIVRAEGRGVVAVDVLVVRA